MEISQFKVKYKEEVSSLLTNLDNTLIELEKDAENIQYVNEAFRAMHTIKGASGMFGFDRIVEITHELEGLYDVIRENKKPVSQLLIEVTFAASDHIRALLIDEEFADLTNQKQQHSLKENIEQIKQSLAFPINLKTSVEKTVSQPANIVRKSTWNILFFPNDQLIDRAVNLVYTFHDLFILGEYHISNRPLEIDNDQFWSIFLVTDSPYDDIESALMFIMDFCKINKLADINLFDTSEVQNRHQPIDPSKIEPAIQDLINTPVPTVVRKETPESPAILKDFMTPVVQKLVSSRISVDASKLDKLMYLVSELITSKSELQLALQENNIEKALDITDKIEKLSKLFSENALSIRLVSLSEMLTRFKRLIRDLAKQLGKEVEFVIIGEETELDKTIIDNIGEPIMHLIRNCIDHGIETPDRRTGKGKPMQGLITFEARKSGNFVFISISDDGTGIDTEYIYRKAVEKGFLTPGTALTQKETLDLIFLPGFSTAQSLTNVSGRGVGMDIVQRKIQEIRGDITISSTIDVGTTFTIKLQQTISIIETLLIKAGGYTYAIPVEDIESCALEISETIMDKQNKLIGYHDHLIPYINLRTKFSIESLRNPVEYEKLIIISRLDKTYAIVADKIIGEFQAVIKPLGNSFKTLKFLSGASLLGDGSIALLIDTDKLWFEMN